MRHRSRLSRSTYNRIFVATLSSALVLLSMVGFAGSRGSTAAAASRAQHPAAAKQFRIELIPGDATDPYYLTLIRGATLEAQKMHVALSWTASPTWDESRETAILRTVIAKKPSAIGITPNSATGMIAPIREATSAHIPVATMDAPLSGHLPLVTQVLTYEDTGGALGAQLLAKLIHDQGDVYVSDADAGDATEIPRLQGFLSYIKAHYPKIHYVGVEYNNDETSLAATQLQDILLRYPHLAGVFATNSFSGMGVGEELKTLGKAGHIKVVAYDADPPEVQYLKEGLFQGLVVQNPYEEGVLVVKYLALYLRGQKVPKVAYVSPILATQQNMNQPAIKGRLYTK